MTAEPPDELLFARLRDLCLVDLDALLAGATGEHRTAVLVTYADDLGDALRVVRDRARDLLQVAAGGPDPLAVMDASFEVRARDGGRDATSRVVRRLAARAEACRALARLDDLAAELVPRLLEVDRRRASL